MENETKDEEASSSSLVTENTNSVENMGSTSSLPENHDNQDAVQVQSPVPSIDGATEGEEGPISVPPPPSPSEPSESNNGEVQRSTSGSHEYTTGAQTRIVTQLIRVIKLKVVRCMN